MSDTERAVAELGQVLAVLDDLPRRVREERCCRGLSLRAAAGEMGVPFNSLTRLERGGGNPTLSNVRAALAWLTIAFEEQA